MSQVSPIAGVGLSPAAQTNDLHVVETTPLMPPSALKTELPVTERVAAVVAPARQRIARILHGHDARVVAIVGPCSIHDGAAAQAYAEKLRVLQQELADGLEIVMRVYFEKPRTTVGWKGLINDPHLDGSFAIAEGLRLARQILLSIAELGLPAATELLDPIVPQYIADLIAWTAIGARTTESQTHREMASGLSMPVGFKNGTDGNVEVAIHALLSAREPHNFLGIDHRGQVSVVATTGNPDCHLVLRGGKSGPNYQAAKLQEIVARLTAQSVCPRVVIDCSHGNSSKDFTRQPLVLADLAQQIRDGQTAIAGVMIESHLRAGRQNLTAKADLVYGQSITDGCIDFETTAEMLRSLHRAVRAARFGDGL